MSSWGRSQKQFAFGVTLLLGITTPLFLFTTPDYVFSWPVWIICTGVYSLASLLANAGEGRQWAVYLTLPVAVAWLTMGLLPALLVVLVGALIAVTLRQQKAVYLWANVKPFRAVEYAYARRVTTAGLGIITSAALYALFGGHVPLVELMPILFLMLAVGLILTHVIGRYLTPGDQRTLPEDLPRIGYWSRWLNEVLLFMAPVPLALIYHNAGFVEFMLLMALIAVEVLRQHQITMTQAALMQRVRELSVLNHVGQNIAKTLAMDEVLRSVYERLNDLTPLAFFSVALLDAHDETVAFPLVIREGQQHSRLRQPLGSDSFIQQVIHSRAVLFVDRLTDTRYNTVFDSLPDDYRAQIAFGIPLITGNQISGVMTMVVGRDHNIFGTLEMKLLETIANQASLAVHNARLYNDSVQLAGNLTQINQSVQDVMFNLNSQDAIQAACKTARQIAQASKVAFFLSDHENGLVRLIHAIGLSDEHTALYSSPIHRPDIYYSDPRIVHDTHQLEERDALRELAEVGHFRATAEVPLKSGSAVVGLLVVFHDEPHHYTRTELELLETLAYQVTAAIDYTELLGALELYASEQAQLVYLSRSTTASLDLETIARSIITMLQQMMNVEHVRIGLYGPDQLTVYTSAGFSALMLDSVPELRTHQNDHALRIYHQDAKSSEPMREYLSKHDETMLVLAPIVTQNRVFGLILLGYAEAHHFSDSERRLIEMATNQIGMQLQNAQAYRSTQEALNRRLQQLSLIEDIARQISSSLDPYQVINNVLDAAILATQAGTCSLGLVREGNFRVFTREHVGDAWFQYEYRFPAPHGVMKLSIQQGEAVILSDNRESPDYLAGDHYHQEYRSSLAVPLIAKTGIIGVLNVESVEAGFFNEERVNFIKNLAGHAVISIQNADLPEEREEQIRLLDSLRTLSVHLSSDIELTSVVNAVLQTALTILRGESAAIFHVELNELQLLDGMRRVGDRYVHDRVLIPDAVVLRAATTGQMQIITDLHQSPDYTGFPQLEHVTYSAVLVAPIKHGAAIHEVLCITLAEATAFTDADRNTLELLTVQAAGHMANARLYDRIQAERSRMRAILDTTRDGIILLDRQGRVVEANISAETLLNISLEDHQRRNLADLLNETREDASDDSLRDALVESVRILQTEPQRIITNAIQTQNGSKLRHFEEVESPVFDENNQITGRLLTLRDVTEEKLLAAYRDEISHMVVHDLRGPLGSIISSLTLTQDILNDPMTPPEAMSATVDSLMSVSLESAENLLRLVDSILDIAKLETRRMTLKRAPRAVDELVSSAIVTLQSLADSADITMQMEVAPGLPPVDVDGEKIRRVLINLLHNAISYTPSGGRVLITATPAGSKKIVVRVADSGPGIPVEEAERVFEKFRQIKSNIPQHGHKGSGLGLTFCKLALEAHGETIWVEPNGPLKGACFAFTLPVMLEQASQISPLESTSLIDSTTV
ncbi:MAG: hypothetical protein OHK0046_49360 [Anaerolineae bacterium]